MATKTKSIVFTLIILLSYSCKEDDFLKGYDRQALFAEPTQQEIDAVIADWKLRDLSPKNYTVENVERGSSDVSVNYS